MCALLRESPIWSQFRPRSCSSVFGARLPRLKVLLVKLVSNREKNRLHPRPDFGSHYSRDQAEAVMSGQIDKISLSHR
jgi:hypothetical protein